MFMDMGGTLRYYRVYNYDVVSWPNGKPSEFSTPKRTRRAEPKAPKPRRTTASKKAASSGTVTMALPNGTVITGTPKDVATVMAAMC